jgi:hypothetical protein
MPVVLSFIADVRVAGVYMTFTEELLKQVRTDADAKLIQFLPSKRGLGLTCSLLIHLLVTTQNELLEAAALHHVAGNKMVLRRIGIRAAALSDLVAYNPQKDLIALVQQHCNYSLEVSIVVVI